VSPPKPLHDPVEPPEHDPPNQPMRDPPGDPTYEPSQPVTEPTPNPAGDPPPLPGPRGCGEGENWLARALGPGHAIHFRRIPHASTPPSSGR
jgi:hypothetical protein